MEDVKGNFGGRTGEWIKDKKSTRSEMRRLTAVYILQVLLSEAPALFFNSSTKHQTIEDLWYATKDRDGKIREKAAKAIGTFLMFVHQRGQDEGVVPGSGKKYSYFDELLNRTEGTFFKENDSDSVHGSMLVVQELLKHPAKLDEREGESQKGEDMVKVLRLKMNGKFTEISKFILKMKTSQSNYIQAAVVGLIPVLATFDQSIEAHTFHGHSPFVKTR